jgi:predicted transcriptional regulator
MSRSNSDSSQPPDDHVPERLHKQDEFASHLNAEGYADVLLLRRESGREVLTESRLELIQYLDRHGDAVESVSDLAHRLDRDKGAVSKDLSRLADLDIITYEGYGDGETKRPLLKHESIVIEPVVY